MELIDNLALGLSVAVTLQNIGYCFVGALLGTLVGVLPGIGPIATIAMLLPITFAIPPASALIMLAGIYYGAQYGGSTTAILANMPGEVSSIVTCLDGFQMARQGRAGTALTIAALGSFFAGTLATVFLAAFAQPLTAVALAFGPAEYFSLMVLGLVVAIVLAHGSVLKAVGMVILGLLFGLVGADSNSSAQRFSFGIPELMDGIQVVVLAMGLFGVAEILANLAERGQHEVFARQVKGLWLTGAELRQAAPAVLRGSLLGSIAGVLPGGGAPLAAFAAYALEKKISRDPSRFGQGAIEGVAGPEAANNAGAQLSFAPMLTLGLPTNGVMALMLGALMIHNIQPGPQVMASNPELFWGLIASMWVGNVLLVILNLPLVNVWARLVSVPYDLLYPGILLFVCIGVYSTTYAEFDLFLLGLFGLLGYTLLKLGCEPAPFLLGFILGPLMEENLRRALVLSRGDALTFVRQPISLAMLLAAAVLLVIVLIPTVRARREEVF